MPAPPEFQALILAAGKGTRMKSERPKVLHEILGRPMLGWVIEAALKAGASRVVCVLGYGLEEVTAWLDTHPARDQIEIAVQHEQLGTAHAVWAARDQIEQGPEHTLILSGDVPNLDAATLTRFIDGVSRAQAVLGVMTAVVDDPTGYGRIVRDEEGDGTVVGIVEHKDATARQRAIREINAGIYLGRTRLLATELKKICESEPDNAQGEYYLTDLIAVAARDGEVYGWKVDDIGLVTGVNTRAHLARATAFARRQINADWMDAGVTFIDPGTTYVEPSVELAGDVVLYPGVHLMGRTSIGEGTVVRNGSVIEDCQIDADVTVLPNCHLEQARVGSGTQLGPFCHLRPGSEVGRDCKVGNFVEVKKSRLADGVKAGHLTYLGDADIGERTNVGAGTITCNYDGERKHRTTIGRDVFIGSNTALVAPVTLSDRAYVGAGSTVTDDVPSEALAVARGRQSNIEGWVAKKKGGED